MGHRFNIGDRVFFKEENEAYIVRALNGRFMICTQFFKPWYNPFYTIVDFKKQIRGQEDLSFPRRGDYDIHYESMLKRVSSGSTSICPKFWFDLNIDEDKI